MNAALQLALFAWLVADPLAGRPDAQKVATDLQQIDDYEQRGRFVAAARRTEDLARAFPQDYGLWLRAGWLRYRAGHWRRAQRHYRRAIELSQGSLDSRLGLGWSLLDDGRRRDAIATFEALERDAPESPRVAEALDLARARPVVATHVRTSLTGHGYPLHPTLSRGIGGQVGGGLQIAEHGLVSASYGFSRLAYEPTTQALALSAGNGPSMGDNGGMGEAGGTGPGYGRGTNGDPFVEDTFDQHHVYAAAGVTWPTAGALLQYGLLHDEGLVDVHAVGTSLRWSPWGDVLLGVSTTIEGDRMRPRVAPSWRLPIHPHASLHPGASIQAEDAQVLGTGRLTATFHGDRGAVWLGGMGGRERRPALLDIPIILNLGDDLRYGVWLGGHLSLPKGWGLLASYELYGLEPADPTAALAQAHYVTVGLSWAREK